MGYVNAIIGTLLVVIMTQVALKGLEKKYQLNFTCRNRMIISPIVLLFLGLSVMVVIIFSIWKSEQRSIVELVLHTVLIWGTCVVAVVDNMKHMIPNVILIILLAVWMLVLMVFFVVDFSSAIEYAFQSLFGGAIGGIVFLLCYILLRRQLGAGDVKLAFVMGLYLTSENVFNAYLIGTMLCSVWAVGLVIKKKIGWKDGIALAPFMMVGTWFALLIA